MRPASQASVIVRQLVSLEKPGRGIEEACRPGRGSEGQSVLREQGGTSPGGGGVQGGRGLEGAT